MLILKIFCVLKHDSEKHLAQCLSPCRAREQLMGSPSQFPAVLPESISDLYPAIPPQAGSLWKNSTVVPSSQCHGVRCHPVLKSNQHTGTCVFFSLHKLFHAPGIQLPAFLGHAMRAVLAPCYTSS
jgi:hypothetical protein